MFIIQDSNVFKNAVDFTREELKTYIRTINIDYKYYYDNEYTKPYDIHQIVLLSKYIDNNIVFDKYYDIIINKILNLDTEFIEYFKNVNDIKQLIPYDYILSILYNDNITNTKNNSYISLELMKKYVTKINENVLFKFENMDYIKYIYEKGYDLKYLYIMLIVLMIVLTMIIKFI